MCQFNAISIEVPARDFTNTDQVTLKFTRKGKETRIAKTT